MQFYLYTVCTLTAFFGAIGLIRLALWRPSNQWEEWFAWRPIRVSGQRRLFLRVMRRWTGNAWEYRELTRDELRESDEDRADYQTW